MDFSQLKEETILVLGGNGFLGARIVSMLYKYNTNIHLSIRKNSNTHRVDGLLGQLNLQYGDLSDSEYFTKLVKEIKPSLIIYVVGYGSYTQQSDRELLFRNNLVSTHNLLMATLAVPKCRIVYAGTSLEQGKVNHPIKEEGVYKPISCYGAMKTASNIMMMQAAIYENRAITLLNPFAIYGIGEPQKRFIPTVIQAALTSRELDITHGGFVRDFVYVDDVADAFLRASVTSSSTGKKINIAGGVGVSNEQIVDEIESLMGVKIKKNLGAYQARATDSNNWSADISKANRILGWKPKHSLKQGLQATIDWLRDKGASIDNR